MLPALGVRCRVQCCEKKRVATCDSTQFREQQAYCHHHFQQPLSAFTPIDTTTPSPSNIDIKALTITIIITIMISIADLFCQSFANDCASTISCRLQYLLGKRENRSNVSHDGHSGFLHNSVARVPLGTQLLSFSVGVPDSTCRQLRTRTRSPFSMRRPPATIRTPGVEADARRSHSELFRVQGIDEQQS